MWKPGSVKAGASSALLFVKKAAHLFAILLKAKQLRLINSSAIAMFLASNTTTDGTITKQCSSCQEEKAVGDKRANYTMSHHNRLGTEQEKHKGIRTAYCRLVLCSSQKQDWNEQYRLQKYGNLKQSKFLHSVQLEIIKLTSFMEQSFSSLKNQICVKYSNYDFEADILSK